MKKYFLLLVASACISVAEAQLVKQNGQGEKKQSDLVGITVLLIKMGCTGRK